MGMLPPAQAAPLPADADRPPDGKLWTVGTLTYTAAGLTVLFSWLLWGDFAWSMKERSVTPVVQLLLKKFQASDTLAGLLMGTLPGIIGMFLGPVISTRSDRHRGPLGRRIPFLLYSTPFAVLAMVGLAFSPQMGGWLHAALGTRSYGLNPSILVVFGLSWATFEVATVVGYAVFGALINDVVPHAIIGRFYALFRALSLLAGMIFNYWLIGKAEGHATAIFLGVGALYGGGFIAMCLKVREGDYPPPAAVAPDAVGSVFRSVQSYFRECFGNPYYVWLFAANALGSMAFGPVNFFTVFFAKSVHMNMDDYGKCIAISYGLSLGLSYLIGWLADRIHPLRAGLIMQSFYGTAVLLGGLFAIDARTFGWALIAHTVLAGGWLTATASLGQKLLPREKYGQYGSAMGLVGTLAGIVMGPAVGKILDLTGHVYRYSFLISFGISMLALGAGLVLYRKFQALGGTTHYVPPQ